MKVFRPRGVRLAGTGSYLPARVVTNAELVAAGGARSPARRWFGCGHPHQSPRAAPGEATSNLAAAAGVGRSSGPAAIGPAPVERLMSPPFRPIT